MSEDMRLTLQRQTIMANSRRMQNIPRNLHSLIPQDMSPQDLARWFEENQSQLSVMTVRQIAVNKGFLKG